MNQNEFDAIKTTFPWSYRTLQSGLGGLVQVFDNAGREVPLLVMVNFLAMITSKLAIKTEQEVAPT